MMRKGSSRKGQRRRRIGGSSNQYEDEVGFEVPLREAPIKLDLSTAIAAKEIVRIEAPAISNDAMEDQGQPRGERTWGRQTRQDHRLIWLSFAGVILVMFVAIARVNRQSADKGNVIQMIPEGIIDIPQDPTESSELYSLLQNSYQKQQQAQDIFRKFTASIRSQEIVSLIRMQENTASMLEKHWKPWPSPPLLDRQDQLKFDFNETEGQAYLSMRGKNADGSQFLAFFVSDGDGLRLDWEATMELGEDQLSSLARFPKENPVTVRVLLSASPYYLPSLPEHEYESFLLTCLCDDTVVWGYVRRGSDEHWKIRDLLRQDGSLFEEAGEVRVTVRLKKTDDISSQNRFFITEMLHKDWVMP